MVSCAENWGDAAEKISGKNQGFLKIE